MKYSAKSLLIADFLTNQPHSALIGDMGSSYIHSGTNGVISPVISQVVSHTRQPELFGIEACLKASHAFGS